MDFALYWFMLPISVGVAATAMLSGIGGAAFFMPIFLLVFPLMGPEYVLAGPIVAIGVALLTQTFGFLSGFVGYYRKGLIDFRSAIPFIAVGVPIAVIGALLSQTIESSLLIAVYAALVLGLSVILLRHENPVEAPFGGVADLPIENREARETRMIRASDGTVYEFETPRQGAGVAITGLGAFLTGMVSVGIGEVVMPQLIKRNQVPVPVAAATSVLVVIVTVAAASFAQISVLIAEGGLQAVPWNLVVYTIPGVIIGGQIGPHLQGKVSQRAMVRGIGVVFAFIAVAMAWIAIRDFTGA